MAKMKSDALLCCIIVGFLIVFLLICNINIYNYPVGIESFDTNSSHSSLNSSSFLGPGGIQKSNPRFAAMPLVEAY